MSSKPTVETELQEVVCMFRRRSVVHAAAENQVHWLGDTVNPTCATLNLSWEHLIHIYNLPTLLTA